MPIGLGLLYAGLLRRKNALSMIFLAVATYTLGLLQWFFWGAWCIARLRDLPSESQTDAVNFFLRLDGLLFLCGV